MSSRHRGGDVQAAMRCRGWELAGAGLGAGLVNLGTTTFAISLASAESRCGTGQRPQPANRYPEQGVCQCMARANGGLDGSRSGGRHAGHHSQ